MKNHAGSLLCIVMSVLAATACAAVPDATQTALLATERQSVQAVCGTKCHQVELFETARKSYEDWHETVQKMVDRGAEGTDEQFLDIMDYLFRTQALIDVNSTDVEDLRIVLEISPAQAQAIAARRAAKKFVNLDDLKSVSGLDAAALDAKAERLVFQ